MINTYKITSTLVTLFCYLILFSCTDDFVLENPSSKLFDESDIITATLNVKVNDYVVNNSTRTEEPIEGATETASEFEKQVDNIWVFQYNELGELLIKPRYYTSEESESGGTWNVLLKPNVQSKIYVVVNIADEYWASNYTSFLTENDLLNQAISAPYPIILNTVEEKSIPMQGMTDNTFVSSDVINVLVTRMYAKIKVNIELADNLMEYYSNVKLNYVNIQNIPQYCRVGSLTNDWINENDPVPFPTGTTFLSRAFSEETIGDSSDDEYPYVIYVPENIRGESENTDPNTKSTDAPQNALCVTANITYTSDDGTSSTLTGLYTIYLGGNNYNNFNVRRNCVYRVLMTIGYPLEDTPIPSANCIVGFEGETLMFYPYYRTEEGGGYKFSDYLDPTDDSKAIKSLRIIWQTENCIGDNSSFDRVTIVHDNQWEDERMNYRIYVQTQKEGNALIAAYDVEDPDNDPDANILWSWHIWVRNEEQGNPTNIARALTYYTYDWDEIGIYDYFSNRPRIPGYQIMTCNLGALQDVPDSYSNFNDIVRTFGTLYQWGRKDPFPPMITLEADQQDYDDSMTGIHYANDNETKVTKDPDSEEALFHSHAFDSNDGMLYAIQHPTIFMIGNSSYKYVWSLDDQDNKEWGGLEPTDDIKHLGLGIFCSLDEITLYDNYGEEKSIFDPCPYGWRVSPGDLWLGFTKNGINAYNDPVNLTDGSLDNINYDSSKSSQYGMTMYLGSEWKKGETSYFPTQGQRLSSGYTYRVGTCGNYSNATADQNDIVHTIHIHYNNVSFFKVFETSRGTIVKSDANSVRCVRDSK